MNGDATAVLACSVVFSIFAVLCGIARVWARKIKNVGLGLDDWIIVVDVPIAFGLAVAAEYMAGKSYIGANPNNLPLPSALAFEKFLYAAEIIVTFVVGTVKISVLLFYKKIFINKRFHQIANFLIACCVCWTLLFIFMIIFQCDPVAGAWNPTIQYRYTYNPGAMWVSMGTTDIALDLSILSLPIPMIASLQMSTIRKVLVGFIFAMGALCVVASATRLAYFVKVVPVSGSPSADFTGSVAETIIWSVIETCLSIIAACLPASWAIFSAGHGLHAMAQRTRSYALSVRNLLTSSSRSVSKASLASSAPNESNETETSKGWAATSPEFHPRNTSVQAVDLERNMKVINEPDYIHVDQTFGYEVESQKSKS